MKHITIPSPTTIRSHIRPRLFVLAALVLTLTSSVALAGGHDDDHGNKDKDKNVPDDYCQLNLVSDLMGVALLQDTNLVNPWGIAFSTTSPFWVSDNGTGLATLYSVTNDPTGMAHVAKLGLQVTIPGDGTPDGQLFDGSGSFNGDIFLFSSEDGTISGWRPALGSAAESLAMPSNTVYKGIAMIPGTPSGPVLLAANFRQATLDKWGTNGSSLTLLAQFSDPKAPAGYAPFNVQVIEGVIFVTYAKQDAAKHDDDAGSGRGLIDIFTLKTGKFHRFATGKDAGGNVKEFNSPWGMALSPITFGKHADQLLVGNFGSGTIMSFDAAGNFQGLLESRQGGPVTIDGLWGLAFGNGGSAGVPGTLYFSAGPNGESDGLFGSLTLDRHHDDDDQGHGQGDDNGHHNH